MLDFALVFAIAGTVVAFKYLSSKAADPQSDEAWRRAARRVGGEVELKPRRLLEIPKRRIRSTIEDVPIELFNEEESRGKSSAVVTRIVTGSLRGSELARIRCEPRDIVSQVSRKLGIGELPTGDKDFDAEVHVSGSPRALALEFLDPSTRRLVARGGQFDLERERFALQREGEQDDSEALVAMIRFAEQLVLRWHALLRGPVRLAERLGLSVDGPPQLACGVDRVAQGTLRSRTVTLSIRVEEEVALTLLSIDEPNVDEWTMERGESSAFVITGTPPDGIRALAETMPRCLLGLHGTTKTMDLAFEGLTPDHEEVIAALDAVLVASTSPAPYR
ncbi:hypothetical protein AKJ09_06886 [Labilithrix luteola]|uniref:Uncharacterized protein n=2 Tax=Labilithrix luteola TaxID=1391654 RepID=A0A0K1Q3C3_9BACT|nr:hypothetical protein AKJ09_06886 [Labilithrix luteola]